VDLPNGGGKVVLAPDYREGAPPLAPGPDGGTWLLDHDGRRVRYPEPPSANCDCPYDAVYYGAGRPGGRSP